MNLQSPLDTKDATLSFSPVVLNAFERSSTTILRLRNPEDISFS
jgi:hypothetical protein